MPGILKSVQEPMTGELIGHMSKHTIITPLNGQSHSKLPLNSYLCIHRLVMLPDLIREVISAMDSGEHGNSDLITVQRMCLSVQPSLDHPHLPLNPPLKLRDNCGRRIKKIVRTWNQDDKNEAVSSRPDRTAAAMSSWQLW